MISVKKSSTIDEGFDPIYEKLVDEIIDSGYRGKVENESGQHARTIIAKLFSDIEADRFIGIFSKFFNKHGFGTQRVIKALERQLNRRVKLKILFQQQPDKSKLERNPFFQEILSNKKYEGLIEKKVLKGDYSKFENHIITVNEGAFRLEWKHDHAKASAYFNNTLIGKKVRETFITLFSPKYSDPLKLKH